MFTKADKFQKQSMQPELAGLRQFVAVLLAVCLLPATSVLGADSTTHSLSRPGRLVDLGTHHLHIFCVGTGGPTVVIDSGLGGSSLEWIKVQDVEVDGDELVEFIFGFG